MICPSVYCDPFTGHHISTVLKEALTAFSASLIWFAEEAHHSRKLVAVHSRTWVKG